MDIRQLHYFLVLCEEMNYTRAAQRLFLSRQALRQSISALEAELCGPLFLSAHHRLSLTDRGVSLQRHAAPVVEQFQQMQAALHAEIQSAQPVRIGISVSLVPDYLPGLETQLDKFRQQYPHIEMRFRLLDNDAVAEGVEQGELDAGLVMDLGCAAPVLARTTLRADPACLLVPRGHPFWEKESVPLAELRNQRVLLPSLRQDLFAPLWEACARAGFAPNAEIGPSFYQAYYLVQEQLCTCLTRYEPGARRELDRVRDVLLEDLPPLCVSLLQRRDHASAYIDLLRSYLMEVLGGAASLPPRRGRSAKPFYNLPVLSSAAAKPAVVHPAPGTQLPFEGGHNFRELGGYEADEGKHIKWGQIYRGIPTWKLTSEADRKLLDSLGLRLILDLRSEAEAAETPDYVPDGARLVRICGLCLENGKEVDFSPEDRENLLKGMPDEGRRMADAPCTSGCSSATRRTRSCSVRWKPVRRRCSSTARRARTAPAWPPSSSCWRWARRTRPSPKTLRRRTSGAGRSWKPSGPSTLRRSPLTPPGRISTSACSASTRSLPPLCWASSGSAMAVPTPIWKPNTASRRPA